jgi:hypothetical protein
MDANVRQLSRRALHSSCTANQPRDRADRKVDHVYSSLIDGEEEDEMYVGPTRVPDKYRALYNDPNMHRNKRDSIHDRKVKRLQEVHAFAQRYVT